MRNANTKDTRLFGSLRRDSASARVTLSVLSLALVLQCLTPPGYMAGSLDEGWPVILCPDGLPADFLRTVIRSGSSLRADSGFHHHHDQDELGRADHDQPLDGHCPLGGVLDGSSVAAAVERIPAEPTRGLFGCSNYDEPLVLAGFSRQLSRAPPRVSRLVT